MPIPDEWPDPDAEWAWPSPSDIEAGPAYFRCGACGTVVTLDDDARVVRCPNERAHGVSLN